MACWRETPQKRGKHRTEATEVTEGEFEVGEISTLRTLCLLAGNDAKEGKHRTEATEVTEGEFEVGEISTLRTSCLLAGNDAKEGKASHGQVLAIDQPLNTVLKACFTEID
jgi:hypothetical protein